MYLNYWTLINHAWCNAPEGRYVLSAVLHAPDQNLISRLLILAEGLEEVINARTLFVFLNLASRKDEVPELSLE